MSAAMAAPMYDHPYPLHSPKSGTIDPLVLTTVFGIIALVTTIMRLASRKMKKVPFGWDDAFIVLASLWTYVMLGIEWTLVVRSGVGHHLTEINPLDAVLTLKMIIPFEAIYALANCCMKLGILFFYLRLFGSDSKFRKSVWVVGIIILLWAIHIILETFLICRPLSLNWDPTVKGICGDRNAMFVVAGATNMVTDLMVMVLPVPTIWGLHMPTSRKLGIMVIFSLGIFISIISIIRLKSLLAISFTDPTATLPMGLMWSVLEPELGIINANLPVLRPFIKSLGLFPSFFRSSDYNTGRPSRITGEINIMTSASRRDGDVKKFDRLGGESVSEDDGTYSLNPVSHSHGHGRSSTDHDVGVGLSRQTTATPVSGMFDPTKPKYNVAVSSYTVDAASADDQDGSAPQGGHRVGYARQTSRGEVSTAQQENDANDDAGFPGVFGRDEQNGGGGVKVKKEFSVQSRFDHR